MIPIAKPSLDGNELKYVSDCITSGWISSQGEYVGRFEEAFAKSLNVHHAIAVSSGTAALHLALKALDVGPGDEVIIPDLTFGAVGNVVLHCGATPVLVDVDIKTWGLDPSLIEEAITDKTKAIIAVHLYGHPCDITSIMDIANKHKLKVIEDCAEAHGAQSWWRAVGTIADIGCFSFFANKIMTTGEGGMIVSHDEDLSRKVRLLRDHGMTDRYWHDEPGFNYRMTNMQAAVGLAQLERIDDFITRKREIGSRYIEQLSTVPNVILPPDCDWARSVYWLFSVCVQSPRYLSSALLEKGIETRPFFYPLHIQPPFRQDGGWPISSNLHSYGISLPSSVTDDEIDFTCSAIKAFI